MDNFTPIRNGLLEHIRDGKLCPFDLGIYTFLQLTMNWETGICFTNARSISTQFGGQVSAKDVRQSLYRLRQKRYINYREGDGSRGSYDVLIHKCRPTVGRHVGMQLNAFAISSLDVPVYEPHNSDATVKSLSNNSATTVDGPLQDLKTLQDVQDVKTKAKSRPFVPPSLEEVTAYCQERRNEVDPQKFLDHYTSNGWKVGRNPMKDWRAAVRTWERNGINHANGNRAEQRQAETINAVEEAKRIMADRATRIVSCAAG